VYYELSRFIELLLRNNPNILELLATPDEHVLFRHPIMNRLSTSLFLSKLCKETFASYAFTQIKKARGYKKKFMNPVEKERKTVPEFCFVLQGYTSIPLNNWLMENSFLPECCGLTAIPHSKGLHALFYDIGNSLGYKGIVSGKAANDLSLSSIPKGEKVIAFYISTRKAIQSTAKNTKNTGIGSANVMKTAIWAMWSMARVMTPKT
jgi:uncharacterized protein